MLPYLIYIINPLMSNCLVLNITSTNECNITKIITARVHFFQGRLSTIKTLFLETYEGRDFKSIKIKKIVKFWSKTTNFTIWRIWEKNPLINLSDTCKRISLKSLVDYVMYSPSQLSMLFKLIETRTVRMKESLSPAISLQCSDIIC